MSVNKVILLGNLGKDPEVRYIENNRVVANFPLATNEFYTDKKNNRVRQTEWHNVELWDSLAKTAEKYLKKGDTIYLEGKIRTDSWTDKEGVNRSHKKIKGQSIEIINNEKGKTDGQNISGETKNNDDLNESYGNDEFNLGDLP